MQVELGRVKGFWSTLQTATTNTSHIFECWAESSLTTDTGENQSAVPCDNDVIRSDWVRPIELHHLELHTRTLYIVRKPGLQASSRNWRKPNCKEKIHWNVFFLRKSYYFQIITIYSKDLLSHGCITFTKALIYTDMIQLTGLCYMVYMVPEIKLSFMREPQSLILVWHYPLQSIHTWMNEWMKTFSYQFHKNLFN